MSSILSKSSKYVFLHVDIAKKCHLSSMRRLMFCRGRFLKYVSLKHDECGLITNKKVLFNGN